MAVNQDKEQDMVVSLNETYANLQAAQTVINNAMKSIKEVAVKVRAIIQEKDEKIKKLEEENGALVKKNVEPKEVKEKKD
jgi:hypothetical protein